MNVAEQLLSFIVQADQEIATVPASITNQF